MRFVTKIQGAFLLLFGLDFFKILWYPCWVKGGNVMAKNRTIPFGYCMRNGEITSVSSITNHF